MGAPQGSVLSPLLFTQDNWDSAHLQKFSEDSTVVGRSSGGQEEDRALVGDFVEWEWVVWEKPPAAERGQELN